MWSTRIKSLQPLSWKLLGLDVTSDLLTSVLAIFAERLDAVDEKFPSLQADKIGTLSAEARRKEGLSAVKKLHETSTAIFPNEYLSSLLSDELAESRAILGHEAQKSLLKHWSDLLERTNELVLKLEVDWPVLLAWQGDVQAKLSTLPTSGDKVVDVACNSWGSLMDLESSLGQARKSLSCGLGQWYFCCICDVMS